MIWTLIGLLLFFWILGLIARVGGGFINLLLAAAVILFIFNLISGRRVGI